MLGRTVFLTDSTLVAMNATRQALEVLLGSQIRFVSMKIKAGKIHDCYVGAAPAEERSVTIEGEFLFEDLGLRRKLTSVIVAEKRIGPTPLWYVQTHQICQVFINNNSYKARWGVNGSPANTVTIASERGSSCWVGTSYQDRRQILPQTVVEKVPVKV